MFVLLRANQTALDFGFINDTQFLLLWESDPSLKISVPVHRVVKDWCDVVARHGEKAANPNSILCYDSYYNTNQSAQVCRDAGIMFLASAKLQ